MTYLARKITRAKWARKDGLDGTAIPADAVTADLRTSSNNLSLWKCSAVDDDELKMIALALASGAERIDKIELVLLEENSLVTNGIAVTPTEGRTPIESLQNEHVDAVGLDYTKLGTIAEQVENSLRQKQYKRFTEKSVRKILTAALEDGRLELEDLADGVRAKINCS